MEWIYSFTPPISPSDLDQIEALLRSEDVFVPCFDPQHRDPYSIATYVEKQDLLRQSLSLFVDRNVVTRWVSMVGGTTATPPHRTAAAILAFAQVCQLLIEPSIAVHEYASSAGNKKAKVELARFYQADNVDVRLWTEVALGRIDHLPKQPISRKKRKVPDNLDKPLYRWQRNYIALLKIAELHLAGGPSELRMSRFLKWMYDDFLLAGAATIFAADYFAPGTPKRGLLKQIESKDREKAIDGIKNAAWDLMLLSDWVRRIKGLDAVGPPNPGPVLCTMDRSVKRIARLMVTFEELETLESELMARLFESIWGQPRGARLAQQYLEYQQTLDNPVRHFNRTRGLDFIPVMIEDGELAIRSWQSKSGA